MIEVMALAGVNASVMAPTLASIAKSRALAQLLASGPLAPPGPATGEGFVRPDLQGPWVTRVSQATGRRRACNHTKILCKTGLRVQPRRSLKNFALIGAAGYIAPRHMQAIHATGNRLLAATDPHDSVGALDRYFPDALFFTEIERFDRFVERARRANSADRIDFVSICSPNYLHDAHARLALRVHADVICEKPLTINPWNLDALQELEREYGHRIYTVLQLRLLASLSSLRKRLEADRKAACAAGTGSKADVVLSYVTRRGPWYDVSWKGDPARSGGVAMNIGIHFFDLLLWLFGACQRHELHFADRHRMAGMLELEHANVRWLLSLDKADLPAGYLDQGKPAYRSLTVDGQELEFTGFTELHTATYSDILRGGGFGIDDARPSVELVYQLRANEITTRPELTHPGLQALTARPSRTATTITPPASSADDGAT